MLAIGRPDGCGLNTKYIIISVFLFVMDKNQAILEIISHKGPVIPVQVSREIKDSVLMASARLSELLSSKKIKISSLKVGGSPLYYLPGQEDKLRNFAGNLGGVEKKAYDLLEKDKVLRDAAMEPAIRVALRQIKDFAVPLQVSYQEKTEIFWKWYLMENKEAEILIKGVIEAISSAMEVQQPLQKALEQQTHLEKPKEDTKSPRDAVKRPQEEVKKEIFKPRKATPKINFLGEISRFFSKSKINVVDTREVKKNSEFDIVIELNTQLGDVKYFCKAKNKKKINEGDLSTALVNAQSKGLPLLFITNGEISKKMREKLDTDFKNVVYREL